MDIWDLGALAADLGEVLGVDIDSAIRVDIEEEVIVLTEEQARRLLHLANIGAAVSGEFQEEWDEAAFQAAYQRWTVRGGETES